MINCVIANHVLTNAQLPPPTTNAPTCRQGYAFAAHLLQHNELHSAANASEHFIGAVIDDDMGDVLEYLHLIKSDTYKQIWERSFANELGRLFQDIRDLAQIRVSSFEKRKSQNTSAPPTVASSAMSSRKRWRSIALDSQLAVISSTSLATRALPLQTFSLPNSSSTPR